MHFVYIVYSLSSDTYYVGETTDVELRLQQHRNSFFKNAYTSKAQDWELKLTLTFKSIEEARTAEKFIKQMKSRAFIERLLVENDWLVEKFSS
jgi:putative endonuclease